MNFDNLIPTENLVLNIVKDKLRHDESVLSICETYQIIGGEYKDRLLALVAHGDTAAIFAFASSKWPPELFSDLTIESVYPLNEDFTLDTSSSSNFTENQFKIHSSQGQSVYYYYPLKSAHAKSFGSFHEDCKQIIGAPKMDDPEKFKWLQKYRREDQSAIDRNIADGTITLQRRESKFREELEKREFEYIIHKDFTIYTATWNVNGRPCDDVELTPWLCATESPPDIYAVAFQELDLSPKAITFSENRPDPIWIRKIMSSLNPNANYEELVSVRLVGMMLTVIVRQELRKNVLRYSTQAVGTGALSFMGNKGGVGVSMQINEAFICFVNSHLAAHSSEIERRKEDHDDIIRRMHFEFGISRRSIDEHNHIFWIGDLNYRLVDNPPRQLFDVTNFSEIVKHDQLYQEMQRQRVFLNYTEGAINFRPTYKYDPGTDDWDSSEKYRAPAWCDRILWKGERISQLAYNSVMCLRLSDHKPVYAVFSTGIKTKDEQKYKCVHEEVLKRVDKYENDNQPQITVEKTDIDFDIIQFNESYTRDITVANNCHLPVRFEFCGKEENGKKICEPWLHVEPTNGELITGDSLSIRFKIFIDVHHAWRMHRKQKASNIKVPLDILVLHVENGRDIFITVLGEYRPSCFGFSVETLARLPQPVYELNLKDLLKIECDLNSSYTSSVYKVLNIPREIYQLVDYLNRNGLKTPNLFTLERKYVSNPLINDIRDWLNLWSPADFLVHLTINSHTIPSESDEIRVSSNCTLHSNHIHS